MADGLADPSPDAVAHHGFTERPGRGEADARTVRLRLTQAERGEQRAGVLDATVVNPSKILGAQQADTFRKTSDRTLPLGAYGQFFASAGAAAGENGAAVLRLHTGAKPVRLGAMAVVGLKGAFRHGDYK